MCILSIGDQTTSTASTLGSAPFGGAACFLVTDVDLEKVSLENAWTSAFIIAFEGVCCVLISFAFTVSLSCVCDMY